MKRYVCVFRFAAMASFHHNFDIIRPLIDFYCGHGRHTDQWRDSCREATGSDGGGSRVHIVGAVKTSLKHSAPIRSICIRCMAGTRDADQGDAARTRRSRSRRAGALCRRVQLGGLAGRHGAWRQRCARICALSIVSGLLLARRPRDRARGDADAGCSWLGPDCLQSAGWRVSDRQVPGRRSRRATLDHCFSPGWKRIAAYMC